jgi:3-hydroxybutyrate dehydrogenase
MLNGLGNAAAIERERAAIEQGFGVRVLHSTADMTRPADIRAMIAQAEETLGRVDILVNNAGIQHVAPVDQFPDEKWDEIIAVNLSAAFHAIKAALPGMKRRGTGRIISIASAHALVASPFKAAYVAAKHGIAGLTKTVALEVAEQGITVNAIAPGYVLTPLVERQIPDTARTRGISEEAVKRDVILAAQPTRRFVRVEEVAALTVHLCSDRAASITGTLLSIDGGWTAQ